MRPPSIVRCTRAQLACLASRAQPATPPSRLPCPFRLFSSESQPLLRSSARPHLEKCLSPGVSKSVVSVRRFVTTEQKQTYVYHLKLGLYYSLIGWTVLAGVAVSAYILRQDLQDRQYPSPREWHWVIKQVWRSAKEEIETEGRGRGTVEWTSAGTQLRSVVSMLEDFTFLYVHRPTGLQLQDDYDRTIPGIDESHIRSSPPAGRTGVEWQSRIGYDVSMKTEQWRRGYFEAMLGVAQAAGYREGYMTDKTSRNSYAPQHVRSPANPYPVPLPKTTDGKQSKSPELENCVPTFEPAEFHFNRILTTKGFSRGQRIEAAVVFANYLEQVGQTQLASDMLDWSLNLAAEGVPDASRVINVKTGVLRSDAPFTTPNIITAATALAGFHARKDDIKRALPIYLSVLRARQTAPSAPASQQYPYKAPDYDLTSPDNIVRWIRSLATSPEYPAAPVSGDSPYERMQSAECEEAGLMAHVGEILFARSSQRGEGIEWTQRAAAISKDMKRDIKLTNKAQRTCESCYLTSLGNLNRMSALLASEQQAGTKPGTSGWFGLNAKDKLLSDTDWTEESRKYGAELLEFEDMQLRKRLDAAIRGHSSLFVV